MNRAAAKHNNYKSPLTIGSGSDARPVNADDFLTKDEFSASQNAHGAIQFQAAYLVGDQLQLIENGPIRTPTISESGADAPSATNPTPPSGTVHQDTPGADTRPGTGGHQPDNTQESSKNVTLDGMKQHVGHDQSHEIDAKVFLDDKAGTPAPAFVNQVRRRLRCPGHGHQWRNPLHRSRRETGTIARLPRQSRPCLQAAHDAVHQLDTGCG